MITRRTLASVHRWVGMLLALPVLLAAVTGAGLAFRSELDPVVYPKLFQGTACLQPLPLDQFAERAHVLYPRSPIDVVRVRRDPRSPVAVRFVDKEILYFDRCTGALAAEQRLYGGVFGTLEYLHRGKWLSQGGVVMGISALAALVLLAGLGVYLWWPLSAGRFARAFVPDRRLRGPAFTLSLHRALGAWAAPIILVSALTSVPNAFDGVKAGLLSIGAKTPATKPQSADLPQQAPKLSLQEAWAEANWLSPAPHEVLIRVAGKARAPVRIDIVEADAPHPNARSYLYLDAYTGRVLRFERYSESGVGSRIFYWMLSLHTGKVGGVIGQLMLFLGALAIPVLAYAGVSSYLRRRLRIRSTARAVA